MKSRPLQVFFLWLLAMALGAGVVWQTRFNADLSFFLPSHPSPEQQVLVNQLKEGAVSRLLMMGISGGTPQSRAQASMALRQRLEQLPHFATVQNGARGKLDAEKDFLFRHRYLLSPGISAERFSPEGLSQAIANSIDLLSSPLGMVLKPYFTRDPSGELATLIESLNPGAEPNGVEGVWASRDGQRAILLTQTTALGSDTDGQEAAIQQVQQAFAQTTAALGAKDLHLDLSGPGLFAVKSRATIQHEVHVLSLVSAVAIIAVLGFVYRSPRLLGLGLLPVVTGALFGIVAVSLAYGTVFGITVGFGSALIGEAVDYSIYYFVQAGRLGLPTWRQRFWPTIRLGVLTSVAGFGALLFSGFPGLSQLGLYALSGVLAAALVTRFVLPVLAGDRFELRDLTPLDRRLAAAITTLGRLRWPVLMLAVAALGYLGTRPGSLWSASLSALSTVSAEDGLKDQRLRADLGAPDSRYMVVVTAKSEEAALQAAEKAARTLAPLVAEGIIGGFDTPTTFLPSQATQKARQALLPDSADARAALHQAVRGLPLHAEKLEPFLTDLALARQAPLITRQDLRGTAFGLAVDSMVLQSQDRWSVLLPLRPPPGDQVEIPTAQVRQALAGSEALFIDLKGEFEQLYQDYSGEATLLSLAGFVAIVLLLAATLRAPGRVASLLLPLLLTVLLVMAGLHLAGEPLHLIHLIGMLLIIAVGSNYALFFDRAQGESEGLGEPGTLASMALANLTTTIGFGTLALSSVPVLHAIGVTVGPGAILALLLSAIFNGGKRP